MRYDKILEQMNQMMISLKEMMEEEQKENHSDPGAYHRKYNENEIDSDVLKKCEEESVPSGSKEFYKPVATRQLKALEYTGKFEKDENGNVKVDENGKPIKETKETVKSYQSSNYNQWSKSINDMTEEERIAIQRKALMNIHAGEDKIVNRDIRTKLVGDKIEFVSRYSPEEEKKRFKFTRLNEVDAVHQIPICKFFINDELIFTMNVENQLLSNPLTALEYKYRDVNDEEKMDEVERLCLEVYRKTGISIKPDEVYAYLDSGYLINGDIDKTLKREDPENFKWTDGLFT